MYFAKSCKYSYSQVSYCNVLTLHRKWHWFGQNTRGHGWGTIHCSCKESCCGRDSYSWFNKHAKQFFELMLVSFILILCVKRCLQVSAKKTEAHSGKVYRVKTRRGVLKTWCCHTFRESDYSVKWKVSTREAHWKELTLIALMTFVDTATLCLKQWNII